MAPRCAAESAATIAMLGTIVAEVTAWSRCPRPLPSRRSPRRNETAFPRRWPHRPAVGVSTGALSRPDGSSQVRCAPVMCPWRSVTAAIIAGQVFGRGVRLGDGSSSADGIAGCRCHASRLCRVDVDRFLRTVAGNRVFDMAKSRRADSRDPVGTGGRLRSIVRPRVGSRQVQGSGVPPR